MYGAYLIGKNFEEIGEVTVEILEKHQLLKYPSPHHVKEALEKLIEKEEQ